MVFPDIHTHSISSAVYSIHSIRLQNDSPGSPELYFHKEALPFFSVGIHPWDVSDSIDPKLEHLLIQYASHPQCVAIGECGLDTLRGKAVAQMPVMCRQIDLATQLNKPVILHLVRAWSEWFRILESYDHPPPLLVHGFRGSHLIAQQLIDRGIFISFGKALLNDVKLQEVFKLIPESGWFLESDMEDLSILPLLYQKAFELRNPNLPENLLSVYESDFIRKFLNFIRRDGDGFLVFQE